MEIILLTGPVNSGKSTALMKLVERERGDSRSPTGIVAKAIFENNRKVGFDILDLSSDMTTPLARIGWVIDNSFQVGRYKFSVSAFQSAKRVLLNYHPDGVVFVDEAGPLELDGRGYADSLRQLLQADISKLYIVIRDSCLKEFISKFLNDYKYKIITIAELL